MASIITVPSSGLPALETYAKSSWWHRAWPILAVTALALVFAAGILSYGNPVPIDSPGYWIIVQSRLTALGTIAFVAVSQALATVLFHTATNNRILTPSILGFDALYVLTQTALVFVFGASASSLEGIPKILAQSALMVLFATLLYGWLFSGKRQNLHLLLLVGVVLGIGFGSVSTLMQRLLTPSEFDVLSARLFGSISKGNPEYLPFAAAIVGAILVFVWLRRRTYDVVSLGRDVAIGLGVNYRREVRTILILVAVLVSVAVTMVGPMTFFGFLVATLTYQFARGDSHAEKIPLAIAIGMATLLGATFVLKHVFAAAGLVTVIIEFAGGILFLVVLLRKGMR
ncbi:iron chelate uptake ABC transporter family permease subunit [Leucobacter insecticola]|uniref:Iron chelate uptake ABC transporter family permease subunit n=1 Tax=Leucobacter insecticola TaxID=2714934 RepID=A0A6G8FHS8_9MICO|nr:iron chelate uptake ABC transporter family permease subunit [Leucobacter insecticola]QIM15592.1 iron chelate uptake ABC transporter family permease subunit [Leucobacter insecticola]